VARSILEIYPGKKLTNATAREVVLVWAASSGWREDRWGNFHPREGLRVKLTKQRVQRQKKRDDGTWSNATSTPLIEAAQNLVQKAAEVLGNEEVLGKVSGAKEARRGAQQARASKAETEARKRQVEAMAAKVISMEDPVGFLTLYETDKAPAVFQRRYTELTGQIDRLQALGRMPTDQDFFRTTHPPLAPVLIQSMASWVEEVDGVPYTVSLRHADRDRAIIEIGSIGSMGLTNRIDPITKAAVIDFERREGDSYISGYIHRRAGQAPAALLFFIQSQEKRRGGGGRALDLWCHLMDSFGVDAWLAEAVGSDGEAFLGRKVASGRLENLGRRGANFVMRCTGGYRGRQLSLTPNTADVLSFPERPPRVEIAGRSYALSKVGVPMFWEEPSPFSVQVFDLDELDDQGARVIDAGGNPWRYVWIYEPTGNRLEMYRYSDGDWKVAGSAQDYAQVFRELERSGQLNRVSPQEQVEFEQAMRERYEGTLGALKEAWEAEKSPQQQQVEDLIARFYVEEVQPEVERAWAAIDRGVYPFDFGFNERIAEYEPREDQARMHVLHTTMRRLGFTDEEGSALERYVLGQMGLEDISQLEDMQSIQWGLSDILYDHVFPTVKR